MKDYLSIGPTPASESCQQLGSPNYDEGMAIEECHKFIKRIREVCGPEKGLSRLVVKRNDHDFGTYYDVNVRFDDEDEEGMDYAYFVESNAPETW